MWINLASLITDASGLLLDTAAAALNCRIAVGCSIRSRSVPGIDSTDTLAQDLLDLGPAVIRGNASEVIALAGGR